MRCARWILALNVLLAACAGLWIDNCEIWTDQPEMPG